MNDSTGTFAPYYRELIVDAGLKDREKLCAYRRSVLEAARSGSAGMTAAQVQDVLLERCRRDVLYFVNVFGWIFEPRPLPENDEKQILPFCTFDYQDEIFEKLEGAWGRKDIDVLKAREQGLTWITLTKAAHDFTFGEISSGQLVSRKQDLVDKAGEQDTLFWKLLFLLDNLPFWMRPRYTKTFMSLVNDRTGYVITGAATTGDVGRGGRKKWIILDEYAAFGIADSYAVDAATQHNTRCRIRISTPQGAAGAFFDSFQKKDSPSLQIRSHWSAHPYKRPGLYTSNNGKLQLIDIEYWRQFANLGPEYGENDVAYIVSREQDGYPFVLDGKLRSPWYDMECRRSSRAWLIAQELDMDFLGSGNQYFDSAMLSRVESMCVPPLYVGEIEYDPDSLEPKGFTERQGGSLLVWCPIDGSTERPSRDRKYFFGADISQGTGASDSALIGGDARTGEQVAELTANRLSPDAFARLCVVVCRWFDGNDRFGARLAWEANGPGRSFGNKVVDLRYRNIYYRRNEKRFPGTKTDMPGWYSTRDAKQGLFGDFCTAINEDKFLVRSRALVEEMRRYTWQAGGVIEHVGTSGEDASDGGDNHGDRVIAAAVAVKCGTGIVARQDDAPKVIPENSIAGRMLRAERLARQSRFRSWW